MDSRGIIEQYRGAIVQIATPYCTGTGFFIKAYDIIITNEHVVRDNKEVVVDGPSFEKQKCQVIYMDSRYDLAFIRPPEEHSMPEIVVGDSDIVTEGDSVIAIGHPFGYKYSSTKGIVSNLLHKTDEINYIQHDAALNPGNSGGPLIYMDGRVIGVNTFIIRDGNNLGFSLPVSYLKGAVAEFNPSESHRAIRCSSCLHVVIEDSDSSHYCPHCGSKIIQIRDIEEYEPLGISSSIETMLNSLGFDVELARRGPYQWEIIQGSAKINISYHKKTGLIVGDAYLCSLPKSNIEELYEFLLQRNYEIRGLTFSVKGNDIIISLLIYDQYLNSDTAKALFEHLFLTADKYDNVLVDDFGAEFKTNDD